MSETWTERAVVEYGYENELTWRDWSMTASDGELLSEMKQNQTAGLNSHIIERTVTTSDWRPCLLGTP